MTPLLLSLVPLLGLTALEDGGVEDATGRTMPALELSAHIEPQPVRLGQRFELVIEVRRQRGELLALPEPLPVTDDLALLGPASVVQRDEAGGVVETFRIPFAAFGLDDVRTPEIDIAKGDERLQVAPLPVEVQPHIVQDPKKKEPPQPAGPSDPVELQRFDSRPLIAAVVLLVVVVLAFILWWWRRRPRPEARVKKGPPPPPAHELALARLNELEHAGWVQQGQLQRFVDEATAILRWYLGERYRLRALDRTSTELLAALQGALDPGLDLELLRELLQGADLVKFARAGTTAQVCADWLQKIRALIVQTREHKVPGGGS